LNNCKKTLSILNDKNIKEPQSDKEWHLSRLQQLITMHQGKTLHSSAYGCNQVMADYNYIKNIIIDL